MNHKRIFNIQRLARCLVASILFTVTAFHLGAVGVTELYSFTSIPVPDSVLVQGVDGSFYGTTSEGGSFGAGTIYRVATNGSITTLLSFAKTNGAGPSGGLTFGDDGALYGTTERGGSGNYGTVFRVTTNGVLTTLVSFDYSNGANPQSGLIQGQDGAFYGTTSYGGGFDSAGTVFRVTSNGIFNTLAMFTNSFARGTFARSGLASGQDGALYGVSITGGSKNASNIYRVTTNGLLSEVALFTETNGTMYSADLIAGRDGAFYGTTRSYETNGATTIFRVDTNGVLATLISWTTGPFSEAPVGPLVQGADGALYGTLLGGRTNFFGTVFRLTTNGLLTTFAAFDCFSGGVPSNGLAQGKDGGFYGATRWGGEHNYGDVYRVSAQGELTELASFSSGSGTSPVGGLVQGADGLFYGTTQEGGISNFGTLFAIGTDGHLTTLYDFTGGDDGGQPFAGLVRGNDGMLYGATGWTVFRLETNGIPTTLARADTSTNYFPLIFRLVLGSDGALYGTSLGDSFGAVFRVTTNGMVTKFFSFDGTNGATPGAGLLLGKDNAFYGTTYEGGSSNLGTVFRITTNGAITTLISFSGTNGAHPTGALALGNDGAYYGTTIFGGSNNSGTVFRVTTNGSFISWISLGGFGGGNPSGGLVMDNSGTFYGLGGNGLFRVKTNGAVSTISSALFGFGFFSSSPPELVLGTDGALYGVSMFGGTVGGGNISRVELATQMQPLMRSGNGWSIRFSSFPDDTFELLRSTNLFGPWEKIADVTAGFDGVGSYIDNDPPPVKAFYRTLSQ